ncbi:hypothetical protein P175DRAFT_0538211 [Aspergillus ochraceoroseus IBT 24754]|uniref:HIT-type domain-containing protein n=1 Tax=Aspergillus ochraceoroseus IBT 24754 TaxID=1392256 RepID=A0A2T5M7E6_9EURO|nr:uncharacterized protein P175DRAFT_0538211 [Aspergillus ochraceoroseus IBT 24754]PTU24459.1 hypothetical protein P175DRAFT_0538211 [Aspergillus ochraceoroseus IBT 24754]
MYHVELIANTSTHVTPGWTYVADRGFDPAKAAIAPNLGRKRGIRGPARTDVSSRRTNAIVRHLAELDRENHKDVSIPIPVKPQKDAGKATRGKVTSNVRRILQSQKTFRNYLDDEEAALAQAAAAPTPAQRPSISKVTKPSSLRRSSTPATATTPGLEPNHYGKDDEKQEQEQEQEQEQSETQLIKSKHDTDPLLRSYIPSAPSERIMQALLAEPPLTYNASRAGPPGTGRAPRHFCCMCGYWGKIRCKNCHQRTCGLDCYKIHEDSRCGAFF